MMKNIYQYISIDLCNQAKEEGYGNVHTLREWLRTLKEYNRYLDIRDRISNDFEVSIAIKQIKEHNITLAVQIEKLIRSKFKLSIQ